MQSPVVFDSLAARGHEPRLEGMTATVRFDVLDGRTDGALAPHGEERRHPGLSKERCRPTSSSAASGRCAERLFTGKANAMSAVLRGELAVEGSADLLVLIQRLLPRPRAVRQKGVAAGHARRLR